MGAQAKMLGGCGWRGQCSCCGSPRGKDQLRAEEGREVREMAAEAIDERLGLSDGAPDGQPVVPCDPITHDP